MTGTVAMRARLGRGFEQRRPQALARQLQQAEGTDASDLNACAVVPHRVFQTPLDIQRGLFASVTVGFLTVTLYELNAGWTTPTWVGAVSVSL